MSTSGNVTWELQSTAIVNSAFRKTGYLSEDQTLSPTALANGVEALNAIVALFETIGMPLWKRTTATFTPLATTQQFNVPGAIKVAQVVLNDPNGSRYPLIEKSRYDFNMLPTNASAGVPVHYEVATRLPLSTAGLTVNIWPYTADASTIANKQILVVYQKLFDGMFNATDTLDFPAYWIHPLILKLALSMAPEHGLPLGDRASLKADCEEAMNMAKDYGDEDGSLFIQPDYIGKQ